MANTAYPNVSGSVTITLYSNIPFDNTYKHHTLISDLFTYNGSHIYESTFGGEPKERYINRPISGNILRYYYNRWTLTGEFNFNFTNGLLGSVTLELTAEQTNSNYMKVVCGNDVYYYFITSYMQVNADTYNLSLECDVLMTYQDEFLLGISHIPVFTNRKHCHRYTSNGLMPYCADFKTGEDLFAGVKPSFIKQNIGLHYSYDNMKKLEGVMWLYICCDIDTTDTGFDNTYSPIYRCKGKPYPMAMVAVPINVASITYRKNSTTYNITYSQADIRLGITKLIGKGDIHGAKISPYPPFSIVSGGSATITKDTSNNLTIETTNVEALVEMSGGISLYAMTIDNNKIMYGTAPSSLTFNSSLYQLIFKYGGVIVQEQNELDYLFRDVSPSTFNLSNSTAPSVTATRYQDPKLLFSPFRKYVLTSQYSSNGWEFYPETILSHYTTGPSSNLFYFRTNASAYIGDTNFYTTVYNSFNEGYASYRYDKIGLMSSVNYTMPCGQNALDVFNATQAQSFYTSKVASGITSGITIAGGIGSIIAGSGMTLASGGGLSPAGIGMVVGGATAIASGTAGIATNIKSVQAKMQDLKNTPDSFNVTGSNFIIDDILAGGFNGLPYLLVSYCDHATQKRADDYFYSYGYQVSRDCYFNLELKVDLTQNGFIDNNLFGRTIFNYIQINEDITNKINANIPLLVKQKLSSIFNNGITLWTFFGFPKLWNSNSLTTSYLYNNWFMKNELDNTEYTQ